MDPPIQNNLDEKKFQILDGVYLKLPNESKNVTSKNKLFSIEVDFNKGASEGEYLLLFTTFR